MLEAAKTETWRSAEQLRVKEGARVMPPGSGGGGGGVGGGGGGGCNGSEIHSAKVLPRVYVLIGCKHEVANLLLLGGTSNPLGLGVSFRMKKRPGIAGLRQRTDARNQFETLGKNVARFKMDQMREQLATFRSNLEDFARKHINDIRRNPTFRAQFHEMCANCGVDPLASNKGFWAELLGIGDFYYELGVQIVDICLATRVHNGGLIDLNELQSLLASKNRASRESVSEDDCLRAIGKLKVLGNGFEVLSVGRRKLVRSVPTELSTDHNAILELALERGYVTSPGVVARLGWKGDRVAEAFRTLLQDGLAMVDDGAADGIQRLWIPCAEGKFSSAVLEAGS
ncbi:hypothetical protein CBR_g28043 [Chara braunii]|uniref:Vacuolar protein sorting-associated protein n=1 Tax=Chara braunii TaxID=69332 RepID=A0A388L923_CHABU|nr:hypothetical protein CBR_g28043 [Chara braunii]|eukprot:GBG78819.1 hypothetical protein CBR_g28043 [Chara braunii]